MVHQPHVHAESEAEPEAPSQCQNCGAALTGPYCGFCGQRALRIDVSLKELAREGVHEFVHLDRRILLTLRMLFTQPGQLTADVLAGRRQRYISPVRLYLVSSILFFLALSQLVGVPTPPPELTGRDGKSVLEGMRFSDRSFDRVFKAGVKRGADDPATFMRTMWSRASKAAFVLVPVFGLLTMAVFRRRVRFFVPHLYFALHFHSFIFLLLIGFFVAGKWLNDLVGLAGILLLPPAYLVPAARRTFETGWGEALWKSTVVLCLYAALLSVAVIAVLLLGLVWR
jgi:hypothetical protein